MCSFYKSLKNHVKCAMLKEKVLVLLFHVKVLQDSLKQE